MSITRTGERDEDLNGEIDRDFSSLDGNNRFDELLCSNISVSTTSTGERDKDLNGEADRDFSLTDNNSLLNDELLDSDTSVSITRTDEL